MSENVVRLNVVTRLDLPADSDGDEYFSSSIADGADVVWLLERCKHLLMRGMDTE